MAFFDAEVTYKDRRLSEERHLKNLFLEDMLQSTTGKAPNISLDRAAKKYFLSERKWRLLARRNMGNWLYNRGKVVGNNLHV